MSIKFLSDESVDGKIITTEIESTGTLLLDAASDITIDAGGQDIILSDDGVIFGTISNSSGLQIRSRINNSDMFLRGVDGGVEFNALQLDMSSQGDATFVGKITSGNDIVNATAGIYTWVGDTDTYIQRSAANEITFKTGALNALVLDSSQNATFANDVTVSGDIDAVGIYVGAVNTSFDFYNNGTSYLNGATTVDAAFTQTGGAASTFSGDITVSGDIDLTPSSCDINMIDNGGAALEIKQGSDLYMRFVTTNGGEEIQVNKNISMSAGLTANSATFSGDITVSGGDITLGGTGRIQGIDTVSAGTDAANKTYVDNAVAGGGSGTVTSVGFSHQGNAFTTGGAPVTSSGTIAITMAGTSSQYIDGAGDLTTFPSIPQGDITEVIAGNKLTGGGTSGSVTLGLASNNISQFTNDSGYTTNTGTMSSWTISSDSGSGTITNGATMKIAGGTNISTSESSGVVTITNGVTNNNQLTNGAGYTTNTGDITNVSTTAPIIGGGASGSVTIEHAASGAIPGIYPNADITVDATGHVTAVASGAPGFISATNAPANFGFQSPEVPDNTGLFAAGWVIINIGGQNYYIPAWTP